MRFPFAIVINSPFEFSTRFTLYTIVFPDLCWVILYFPYVGAPIFSFCTSVESMHHMIDSCGLWETYDATKSYFSLDKMRKWEFDIGQNVFEAIYERIEMQKYLIILILWKYHIFTITLGNFCLQHFVLWNYDRNRFYLKTDKVDVFKCNTIGHIFFCYRYYKNLNNLKRQSYIFICHFTVKIDKIR